MITPGLVNMVHTGSNELNIGIRRGYVLYYTRPQTLIPTAADDVIHLQLWHSWSGAEISLYSTITEHSRLSYNRLNFFGYWELFCSVLFAHEVLSFAEQYY